ncbi:DUF222 domain-containing protein [[Mycobacterium] kokjensenii]|uniref:DUF222 domain-containing protein n=1 Tax=[Mycobacterium] kokjensenii TaxID=3064287 RepID=A0ABM9LQC9_9MYCO|nr:HNH endonuclease signature motif containing protein [Mycolicibacter sp. MU0083]CAJ1502940.1 DUF222 domain-containing protein [Mycolicibacter sp. MU0083]
MSSIATSANAKASPAERLDALFEELSQLCGQRNAIDGRIVDIVAEIDHDGLWGATGARSIAALVAWKTGSSPGNAHAIAAVAHRTPEFPRCTHELREGRLSLDQVAVIAERAADGSDDHYAELASVATVSQLRTAIKLEPRPDPGPTPDPTPAISKTSDTEYDTWRIRLPHPESAMLDAALQSHRDALITTWKHDLDAGADSTGQHPPMPTTIDAFLRLIESGWDTEARRRPHGQRTTVVVHVDADTHLAGLHLGPLLSDPERQYLTCDATCEVWFQRHGRVIGAGRNTRTVGRRLRRALEHRDRTCVIPGCGATAGLHAHHIVHWEDGGPTDLSNLVLVCPYHHRQHHRGLITITGPAEHLTVTDDNGHPLQPGSLARTPTTPPPAVPPYPGPTGERADWWWYPPFQPQPPPPTD